MKSALVKKRSIIVVGHRTSISLEDEFWTSLKTIAEKRHQALSALVALINEDRDSANLSSAIRMFVLRYYRDKLDILPPAAPHLVATVDLLAD
jgi:predicted DNA-binding ribbon-helix-helix protein